MRPLLLFIKDWFNPEVKGRGLNGIAYMLFCAVLLAGFGSQQLGVTSKLGGLVGLYSNGCDTSFAPTTAELHLPYANWVVHSPCAWDSGTLGSQAVDDADYGLGYGASVAARLPGQHWAVYRYLGSGWIPGSGGYETFEAPNHGHLSWYHLPSYSWHSTMRGGDQFAVTGWPTDPTYAGGGPAGPSDAHMCIAYDWLGQQWLESGIYHRPPTPKFPVKVYEQYRSEHHKSFLSPYSSGHKLNKAARLWWKHDWRHTGGIVRPEQWNPRGRHVRDGFERDYFQGAQIVYWPLHPSWHPKWVKNKRWIR